MDYYGNLNYYNENLVIYPDAYSLWDSYTDNQKIAILKRLSKELDISFRWAGVKTQLDQNLEFPRNFFAHYQEFDGEIFYPDDNLNNIHYANQNKIPESLYDCMVDLINFMLASDKFLDLYNKGVRSINDGVISVSLDSPSIDIVKSISGIVEKHLFWFTITGYTEYKRQNGTL